MADRRTTQLRRPLVQWLESLEAAGVQQIGKGHSADVVPRESAAELRQVEPAGADHRPTVEPDAHGAPDAVPAADAPASRSLDGLREEVAACKLCHELACSRTQTVFGVGHPGARLCFLGEAPGADEDRQGEPFVGRAGQLLNKILEACGLSREEVYILNVLKCRPPGNRNPAPEESQNCRPFLDRQLQLIDPEFVCCLGAVACKNLLTTTAAIGRLRGRLHDYRGMRVICTYHPAYLLRNPAAKRHTWDDMKLLMREMGTPVD